MKASSNLCLNDDREGGKQSRINTSAACFAARFGGCPARCGCLTTTWSPSVAVRSSLDNFVSLNSTIVDRLYRN